MTLLQSMFVVPFLTTVESTFKEQSGVGETKALFSSRHLALVHGVQSILAV